MLFVKIVFIFALARAEDLEDFEFYDPEEVMIAQESRHYETIVTPPVMIIKPSGVTNSHRPQYNVDSMEAGYEPNTVNKEKEGMVRDAVLRALEKRNNMGKFAQILPIIRAMSGNQRVALASLVASQVTTPPGRQSLSISQVRSLLNNNSTADLMLPILLDTANLFRKALRSGKQPRDIRYPPRPQFQRRSYTEDTLNDDPFEIGVQELRHQPKTDVQQLRHEPKTDTTSTQRPEKFKMPPRNLLTKPNSTDITQVTSNKTDHDDINDDINRNVSKHSSTDSPLKTKLESTTRMYDNGTIDLMTDATNQTIAQDLPVAEKLRSLNRYIDRKGNLIRRGTYPPKPPLRRTTAEPTIGPITRRRPIPARKLPMPVPIEHAKCELFTNSLCLHSEDYPTDAIIQSIRRNKAAASALLADFKEPGEGAVDGITAAQEAKYTADHYFISNRRGDTANRDFAGAGEAGFMCPSTVKYARPQRARATSGQWKYIVNTGEHTQTLRLEKCLKPKEPCTYLTDNFKSKCVQVYNYHRLLTWDQQNGLHMDIFKVPTCCSCHIEGYSVSFPPVGQRVHETSSEHFPGEDLSSEQGNRAFEDVQQSVQRPSRNKSPGYGFRKPAETFSSFDENHNVLQGSSFSKSKVNIDDLNNIQTGPKDSYGNSYFQDTFNQASSIRTVKRPVPRNPAGIGSPTSLLASDSATLPSYLEPPTPSAPSSSFSFSKDPVNKYKVNDQFKRGPVRPNRRPIRKKISAVPDDLMSSGTSAIGAYQTDTFDTMDEIDEDLEEPNIIKTISHAIPRPTIATKLHSVTENNLSQNREQSEIAGINDDGKKINYNYHPIIDFFGEEEKENESIDREDNLDSYSPSLESEWKPINHTPVDRRKH